jgi:hypothetical protein
MSKEKIKENALHLQCDLDWLETLLEYRIFEHFGDKEKREESATRFTGVEKITDICAPVFRNGRSAYTGFLEEHSLSFDERALLVLALAPHLSPALLDVFKLQNKQLGKTFTEFGGIQGKIHSGFLPTAETFLFLIAGDDLEKRMELMALFDSTHFFVKRKWIMLEGGQDNEPHLSGAIVLSRDLLELFTTGEKHKPVFGNNFPAKTVTTEMEWNDLVLGMGTLSQINDLRTWLKHNETMMRELGMKKKVKPGYKVLFHGPPGTGKTLTACLLGKETGKEVYRIDLSMVVSKYIGETEKNLAKVFDKAEYSNWILFFDEADALFGARTKVDSSHDRYANQEVSYLLQRIEDYSGLVVLASNFKNNIDHAFLRRFQSIVHFPPPKAEERQKLWKKSFPEQLLLEGGISLQQISKDYELTGAHIMNIISHCTLNALANGDRQVTLRMLKESISRELSKEGRTL